MAERFASVSEDELCEKCIIKQLLNSVFAWYNELSKPRACVICLSLRLRQITQTSVLIINDIMLNLIQIIVYFNNGVFAITKSPLKRTFFQYPGTSLWRGATVVWLELVEKGKTFGLRTAKTMEAVIYRPIVKLKPCILFSNNQRSVKEVIMPWVQWTSNSNWCFTDWKVNSTKGFIASKRPFWTWEY